MFGSLWDIIILIHIDYLVAGGQPTERRKLLSYRVHHCPRHNSEQKRYQNNALSDDTTSALPWMKRADAMHNEYARLYAAQTNAA
jgi:hypothetical protein